MQHKLPIHTAKYLTWITPEVVMIKDLKEDQSALVLLRQTDMKTEQRKVRKQSGSWYSLIIRYEITTVGLWDNLALNEGQLMKKRVKHFLWLSATSE